MTQGMAPNLADDDSGRVDLINSALEKFSAPVAIETPFADDEIPEEVGDLESAEADNSVCGEQADDNSDTWGNPANGHNPATGDSDGWML